MSTTAVIRYQTTPESAARNRELIERVFAELAERRPDGLHYAAFQLDDGVGFVHVVSTEDGTDPLAELPAFQEFQRGVGDRLAVTPDRAAATEIGSYHP
jgi:hypothetical protein